MIITRRALIRNLMLAKIIKSDDAFEALHQQVMELLVVEWDKLLAVAIADALTAAEAGADVAAIATVIESAAGGVAMEAAVRSELTQLTQAIVQTGWTEASVGIGFNVADTNALAVLKEGNLFWVREHWNEYTGNVIQKILDDSFAIGGDSLANRMRNLELGLGSLVPGTENYWRVLADHIDTKTREIGRIMAYEKAGVDSVRVKARIDARTTPFCRAAHGKVLLLSDLKDQKNKYLVAVNAKDKDAVKNIWPMKRDATNVTGNIGMPPYHFRCRTVTVANI